MNDLNYLYFSIRSLINSMCVDIAKELGNYEEMCGIETFACEDVIISYNEAMGFTTVTVCGIDVFKNRGFSPGLCIDGKWEKDIVLALHKKIKSPRIKFDETEFNYFFSNYHDYFHNIDLLNKKLHKYNKAVQVLQEGNFYFVYLNENLAATCNEGKFAVCRGYDIRYAIYSNEWFYALKEAIFDIVMEETKEQMRAMNSKLVQIKKQLNTATTPSK